MGSETGGADREPEPEGLPHTRARARHWAVTAAALAAVVNAAALMAPARGTDGPAHPGDVRPAAQSAPSRAPRPAEPPDPGDAEYPLDCAGAPVQVARQVSADLDGDGRPETAAAVHCRAGGGNPPHALFVLSRGARPGDPPRIVARLDNAEERVIVTALSVRDRTLVAEVSGYSGPGVPGCCPDISTTAEWKWTAGGFVLVPRQGAAAV